MDKHKEKVKQLEDELNKEKVKIRQLENELHKADGFGAKMYQINQWYKSVLSQLEKPVTNEKKD